MLVCKETGIHQRPIHLNRGRHGSVWLCLSCGKQIRGIPLPQDELEALKLFAKILLQDEKLNPKRDNPANAEKEIDDMKLELAILAGAESKAFLLDFKKQIDRLETLTKSLPATSQATVAIDVTDDEVDTLAAQTDADEDFAPKKSAPKRAAPKGFDDEETSTEDSEASDDDGEMDFNTPPPVKAAPKPKPKKLSPEQMRDNMNEAAKAKAAKKGGKAGRDEVLGLMKKHFNTTSVQEIKSEDYDKFLKLMAV